MLISIQFIIEIYSLEFAIKRQREQGSARSNPVEYLGELQDHEETLID